MTMEHFHPLPLRIYFYTQIYQRYQATHRIDHLTYEIEVLIHFYIKNNFFVM